jgi:hypothetical protein
MTILEPVASPTQDLTSPQELTSPPGGHYDSENPPFVAATSYYGEPQATPTPVILSATAQVPEHSVTSAPVSGQSGAPDPAPGQTEHSLLMRKRLLYGVLPIAVCFFIFQRFVLF